MRSVVPLLLVVLILTSVPAFAQTDFSGEWTRIPDEDSALNPDLGDWFGLPLNAAALRRAETTTAVGYSQCIPGDRGANILAAKCLDNWIRKRCCGA